MQTASKTILCFSMPWRNRTSRHRKALSRALKDSWREDSSSATFELSYFGFIMCIRCTDDGILSTVSIVTKGLLSSRDLVFEAFVAEDIDVQPGRGRSSKQVHCGTPKSQARSLDQLDWTCGSKNEGFLSVWGVWAHRHDNAPPSTVIRKTGTSSSLLPAVQLLGQMI